MSPPAALSSILPPVAAALRQRIEAIRENWRGGELPDARAILGQNPELGSSKPAVVELAYEEFCLRREAGEILDPDAFAAGFGAFRTAVRRQLRFDSFLGGQAASLAAPLESEIAAAFGAAPPQPPAERLHGPAQPRCWPQAGETLGDFTLVRLLGKGSFAQAYLATESSTGDRPVVVKLALEGGAEARTLGRLSHPNIVPVLSCRRDLHPELTVICMPFLGSATLEDVRDRFRSAAEAGWAGRRPSGSLILQAVRAAALPDDPPTAVVGPADGHFVTGSYSAAVLHIGAQLAEALAFVHQRGVLHRDLKPSNVLLGPNGCPRLLDFNLAVDAGPAAVRIGGTIPYAAPEHLRALLGLRQETPGPPDGRADVYSLAVILVELLTGRHPFGPVPRGVPLEVQGRTLLHQQGQECRLPQVDDLDGPTVRLLVRCLAYDPQRRPAAAEVAAGLRAHFAWHRRLRRCAARRPVTALGAALLAGGAMAWSASSAPQPPEARSAYSLGRDAFRAGHYAEAQGHFGRALAADPEDARKRFAHACTLMKRGQAAAPEEADTLLSAAVAEFLMPPDDPRQPLALACQAYCVARLGNQAQALRRAELAEKAGFHSTALRNNRAYSHLRRGELAAAAACLAAIPAEDVNHPAVCVNRAHLALQYRLLHPETLLEDSALDDVRRALQPGPADRHVCQIAAALHALAAEDRDRRLAPLTSTLGLLGISGSLLPACSAAVRDHHAGQLTAALRRAVVGGLDPRGLGANSLWKAAHGRADFQALCEHPPAATAPLAHSLPLIDPLDELPD
jgi:serine/threonine protein kinase/Flp pilus assembly protein TadD